MTSLFKKAEAICRITSSAMRQHIPESVVKKLNEAGYIL